MTGPAIADTPSRHAPRRIELNLVEMDQLFNSMDPAPFIRKDLDRTAEEFIVGWAHEYALNEPITLRIHLQQWPDGNPADVIPAAIHNYFAYRTNIKKLELRRLFKQARSSLIIGILFLAGCLFAGKLLPTGDADTWSTLLHQSLTIAGWVAMWRPMQLLLYDWWPLRHQTRVLQKLATMPIEVIHAESGVTPA